MAKNLDEILDNTDERAIGEVNRPVEQTYRKEAKEQILNLALGSLPEKKKLNLPPDTDISIYQLESDSGFNQALTQMEQELRRRFV